MRRLGVHTSIAGGIHLSLERASDLSCSTVQIFSHNPRGWAIKAISDYEASLFKSIRAKFDISPVYIHASYLINIASRDDSLSRKSIELLITEMERADAIGADYVILHPGSASGDDEKQARRRAIEGLSEVSAMGNWSAGLLIENTAGERGDISSRIHDLAEITAGVTGNFISGVCIDTCHAFAAGYDISNNKGIAEIIKELREHIGIEKIKLMHLNDSKGLLGSGVDRHEHIGIGKIGFDGLRRFINHPQMRNIPLILETPRKTVDDDPENLKKVRRML